MFKSLFLLKNKIINIYIIFQNIIHLRKIKPKFLFFSENKNYQKFSYLIIEALAKNNPKEVYYVSSEIDDKIKILNVKNIFIGNGLLMNVFFLIVKAENMFLTVTDLDNHAVKKTKNIDNYVYYFHGAVSTTKIYTATAFDNYDIILCNGNYHLNEIRKRESIKKIKKKKLIKTGYFYFDYLNERINPQIQANEILIAPSWNYNQENYININFEEIIQSVLDKGFNVRFRPHPEIFKRSPMIIDNIKKKFFNKNFILDENSENINSMENAKCLITDNSGIAIEFLLLFKKPVLYFENCEKIHNTEFNQYSDLITIDQKVKESFGYTFKKENIKDLDVLINKSISEFKNKDMKIKNFIDNNFYNNGSTIKSFNELISKGF
jgi:hypothetical protein